MDRTTLVVPHEKKDCHHPQFHSDAPDERSMLILENWLRTSGWGCNNGCASQPLTRVAPLCEFGALAWKNGPDSPEEAKDTWAVCPNCHEVVMCGFVNGMIRLGSCWECEVEFSLVDCFQGVYENPCAKPEEVPGT